MTTTPAMPDLLREIVAYCREAGHDWSNLAEAEHMLATLQAQPAEVSDAQIAAGMRELFAGPKPWPSWEVTLKRVYQAMFALRPQAVTSEPGAYESRYAEWRQFYGNRITQWMSADELRLAVSRLMTVDAGSPELLLIHAMHLIDQAAPEWIAGEPANLQAAARDADEWLALIQRLNDAGRWRFSQPDSRAKLDGCRVALSKILCADRPQAVPMTEAWANGVQAAADLIKRMADETALERGETDPDTGAIQFKSAATREWHSSLCELAEEIERLKPAHHGAISN